MRDRNDGSAQAGRRPTISCSSVLAHTRGFVCSAPTHTCRRLSCRHRRLRQTRSPNRGGRAVREFADTFRSVSITRLHKESGRRVSLFCETGGAHWQHGHYKQSTAEAAVLHGGDGRHRKSEGAKQQSTKQGHAPECDLAAHAAHAGQPSNGAPQAAHHTWDMCATSRLRMEPKLSGSATRQF